MRKVMLAVAVLLLAACGRGDAPPAAAAVATGPAPAAKVVYVGSSKSNIYHVPTCRSAVRIAAGNLISFASRDAAEKAGYRPCKVCKP